MVHQLSTIIVKFSFSYRILFDCADFLIMIIIIPPSTNMNYVRTFALQAEIEWNVSYTVSTIFKEISSKEYSSFIPICDRSDMNLDPHKTMSIEGSCQVPAGVVCCKVIRT